MNKGERRKEGKRRGEYGGEPRIYLVFSDCFISSSSRFSPFRNNDVLQSLEHISLKKITNDASVVNQPRRTILITFIKEKALNL